MKAFWMLMLLLLAGCAHAGPILQVSDPQTMEKLCYLFYLSYGREKTPADFSVVLEPSGNVVTFYNWTNPPSALVIAAVPKATATNYFYGADNIKKADKDKAKNAPNSPEKADIVWRDYQLRNGLLP